MFSKKHTKPQLIFIVEDNMIYAKTLETFLKLEFGEETKTEIFPVGELCVDNLHRKPDFIIMDYYLDSKFFDAANGLDITRQIKTQSPKTEVIVLSGQNDMEVTIEATRKVDVNYVIKNDGAYRKVHELIMDYYRNAA